MIPGARGRGEGATPARPSAISSRRPGEALSSVKPVKVAQADVRLSRLACGRKTPDRLALRRPGQVEELEGGMEGEQAVGAGSREAMKVAISPTSRSSTYPGTRRVLATRGGGTGRSGIRFAARAMFPRVRRFEIPVRAMCRVSSFAFRSSFTHTPDATAGSIIPSRSAGCIVPFVSQQTLRILPGFRSRTIRAARRPLKLPGRSPPLFDDFSPDPFPRTSGPQENDRGPDFSPPPLSPRRSTCAGSSGCTPSHRAYTDGERLPDAAMRGREGAGVPGRSIRPRNTTADRGKIPSWIGSDKRNFLSGNRPRRSEHPEGIRQGIEESGVPQANPA